MVATKKMTHLEFIQKAYETLRKPGKDGKLYMGMHVVYTGFNEAFRKYFDTDPIKAVSKLAESGELRVRAARGGAIIYLGDDVPAGGGDKALEKMGLAQVLARPDNAGIRTVVRSDEHQMLGEVSYGNRY